jgi:hypothetical protein
VKYLGKVGRSSLRDLEKIVGTEEFNVRDLGQKYQRAEVVENQVEAVVEMMGVSKSGRGTWPGTLGKNRAGGTIFGK